MTELALHILDLAENGIRAGASELKITLVNDASLVRLTISIEDNGHGMNQDDLARTKDPFFTSRTTRKVGLGIPLFRQHAELTGGEVQLSSSIGEGTAVFGVFKTNHPDIQPLGDLAGCAIILMSSNSGVNIKLHCKNGTEAFEISSQEIMESLGIDTLSERSLQMDLKRLIQNNLDEIGFNEKIISK